MAYRDLSDPRNKEAKRRHYYANKEQYLERNRLLKAEMRAYTDEAKGVPCLDCNNSFPSYVMDFHHRDPATKVAEIGVMINRGSWKNLLAEIGKCDIICANCHRVRTHGSS